MRGREKAENQLQPDATRIKEPDREAVENEDVANQVETLAAQKLTTENKSGRGGEEIESENVTPNANNNEELAVISSPRGRDSKRKRTASATSNGESRDGSPLRTKSKIYTESSLDGSSCSSSDGVRPREGSAGSTSNNEEHISFSISQEATAASTPNKKTSTTSEKLKRFQAPTNSQS